MMIIIFNINDLMFFGGSLFEGLFFAANRAVSGDEKPTLDAMWMKKMPAL